MFESFPKPNKIQRNNLYYMKETTKELPFKKLNFNPQTFINYKYSSNVLMLMDKKRNNIDSYENKTNSFKKENRDYIFSLNLRKIKLKPLNKNRSNSQLMPKKYSIVIPSQKTTQDLMKYNMSNTHNTLLNYYHKNNRNVKVINFAKNNANENINCVLNSSDRNPNHTFNKSLINNSSGSALQNDGGLNNNTNDDGGNLLSNQYIKTNIEKTQTSSQAKKQNANMKKSKKSVELQYEAEMMNIKLPHNLKYFAEHLFKGHQIDKDSKRKTSSGRIIGNRRKFS